MPGFLTHYLAGQAALIQLPDEINAIVKGERQQIFTLGAQGPDIFFYYAPGFARARIRGIGTNIHDSGFAHFFMYMARINKHITNAEQKEVLFAYLAGFLVHYCLDVNAHPFVNAHSQEENKTAIQRSAAHRHLETVIDVLMLARLRGEKPADYNQADLINAPALHKRIASAAFATAASKVYGCNMRPQDVYHAMGHMTALTRLLHSNGGRRKRFAEFLEEKTVQAHIISSMVHMQEVADGKDHLNLSRLHWNESTASFPELFDTATEDAANMIQILHKYIYKKTTRAELAKIIGNFSLSTGDNLA
ncbi:MAG: zinc dependent phospholipase C family protein [Defluviitaleaceae bacterium]|nr:zinc dependent phospholipase C family protein [Defluviitaleaceae bacterium]MCL2276096.1 zinc dependent phospholipase C family protein [Defluviitaleaceae bacterium]